MYSSRRLTFGPVSLLYMHPVRNALHYRHAEHSLYIISGLYILPGIFVTDVNVFANFVEMNNLSY